MQTAYWPDRLDFDQSISHSPPLCPLEWACPCPLPLSPIPQDYQWSEDPAVCVCAKFGQLCCFSKILTRKVCAITKQITSSILQNNRNLRSFKSFLPSQHRKRSQKHGSECAPWNTHHFQKMSKGSRIKWELKIHLIEFYVRCC